MRFVVLYKCYMPLRLILAQTPSKELSVSVRCAGCRSKHSSRHRPTNIRCYHHLRQLLRVCAAYWSSTHVRHLTRPCRYSPNSTWLVSSRHERHVRRVERVEPCCSTASTQPKCMGSTRRACRVVSRRYVTSQVEFGPTASNTAAASDFFCRQLLFNVK